MSLDCYTPLKEVFGNIQTNLFVHVVNKKDCKIQDTIKFGKENLIENREIDRFLVQNINGLYIFL